MKLALFVGPEDRARVTANPCIDHYGQGILDKFLERCRKLVRKEGKRGVIEVRG